MIFERYKISNNVCILGVEIGSKFFSRWFNKHLETRSNLLLSGDLLPGCMLCHDVIAIFKLFHRSWYLFIFIKWKRHCFTYLLLPLTSYEQDVGRQKEIKLLFYMNPVWTELIWSVSALICLLSPHHHLAHLVEWILEGTGEMSLKKKLWQFLSKCNKSGGFFKGNKKCHLWWL